MFKIYQNITGVLGGPNFETQPQYGQSDGYGSTPFTIFHYLLVHSSLTPVTLGR